MGLNLYALLAVARRRRRTRLGRKPRNSVIPAARSITERPAKVAARQGFGHWEGDLVIFARQLGKANVTSLQERPGVLRSIRDGGAPVIGMLMLWDSWIDPTAAEAELLAGCAACWWSATACAPICAAGRLAKPSSPRPRPPFSPVRCSPIWCGRRADDWVDWDEYVRIVNRSRLCLNSAADPTRLQIKGKIFDYMACGVACLTDSDAEVRRFIPDGADAFGIVGRS